VDVAHWLATAFADQFFADEGKGAAAYTAEVFV